MPEDMEAGTGPTGTEKLISDAVADLRSFCDAMRSDFSALSSRMDAYEAGNGGSAAEVPAGGAVELEDDATAVHPPVEILEDGTENADAALELAEPVEIAADAGMDMDALNDSVSRATAPLRADIARLTRMLPAELTIEQRQQFATAQEQAEIAFQSFGDHAPAPMQGESIGTYKRRLAAKMQPHSAKWKGTKLTAIADDATLDVIVADIYNDAAAVARRGADVAAGKLMPVSRRTPAGHTVVEYRGSPGAWMRPLAGATRRATGKFNTGR